MLTRLAAILMLAAMTVVGTGAVARATLHAATPHVAVAHAAQMPPCHHMTADEIAPAAANGCDTVCAGSAPEFAQDSLLLQPLTLSFVTVMVIAEVEPLSGRVSGRIAHHGPAPPHLPLYLQHRRLLI